jgi:hypothetical protein
LPADNALGSILARFDEARAALILLAVIVIPTRIQEKGEECENLLKYTSLVVVYVSMNKIILGLMAVVSLTMTANANLHDTYSESCQRYGGKAKVTTDGKRVKWIFADYTVIESFVNNECVAMLLVPAKGKAYNADNFEALKSSNCGTTQTWVRDTGEPDPGNLIEWSTTDNLIGATLRKDGMLQFAYMWFLQNKGLLTSLPDYGSAPVEDGATKTNI